MASLLERCVAKDRSFARGHLRLAANYLQQFHLLQMSSQNPMDLAQIRDAAIASRFESRAALDEWLDRAFGPRRKHLGAALWHAHRAAALCPVQGEAYLYLAEGPHLRPFLCPLQLFPIF